MGELGGASRTRTDIPEKHHDEAAREKYTVCYPQYDRRALLTITDSVPVVASTNCPYQCHCCLAG